MQIGTIWVFVGYVVIAGGLLTGSLFVAYGNKLNLKQELSGQKQEILEQQKMSEMAIKEYIKTVLTKGDEQLVKQIPKRETLDFRTGTIVFHVLKNDLFNNKELNLLLVSKDPKAYIRFYKDRNDYIKFTYEFPVIGKLEKGYQLTQADIQKRDTTLFGDKKEFESVFLGFAWNLEEKKTILWINGIGIK